MSARAFSFQRPSIRRPELAPAGSEVRALGVVAVRRPLHLEASARCRPLLGLLRLRLRRDRAQGFRELLGRRAANVARPLLVPGPGPERGPEAEREQAHGQERPAQDPDPAAQERVGEREHDACGEQDLRSVGDCAFDRCGERQDPEQVSERWGAPRRLPDPGGRWQSPSVCTGPAETARGSSGAAACPCRSCLPAAT